MHGGTPQNSLIIAPEGSELAEEDGGKEALLVRTDDSYELSLYVHYFQV